jgi:hypothetical protein
MTPELWNMITKIASFGDSGERSMVDPNQEAGVSGDEEEGKDYLNESFRPKTPPVDPATMQRLQQHVQDHKLMESLGLDHDSPYEEQMSQTSVGHPTVEGLAKESAKKKIYRYIKGQRRAWYVDDDIEKKASRAKILKNLTKALKKSKSKAQYHLASPKVH